MVEEQLRAPGIASEPVLGAMGRAERGRFIPPAKRPFAYRDVPVPIGFGQTVPQPYMVALICEAAVAGPGSHVLDVGTGSRYRAAVLAELGACVLTIERIPGLAARATRALDASGYRDRATVHVGDGTLAQAAILAVVTGCWRRELP